MAKYTVTIDEATRQRILALPRGVNFGSFMRKAMTIFLEEIEKKPELEPAHFVITLSTRKDTSYKERR